MVVRRDEPLKGSYFLDRKDRSVLEVEKRDVLSEPGVLRREPLKERD